jgi:hypothetical protein
VADTAGSNKRPVWAGPGRISDAGDVRRLLTEVNSAGLHRDNTALALQVVQSADDAALTDADAARVLRCPPELWGLLPWPGGIRRGATVAAVGSASLLITLLAGAMVDGSWGAVCGLPALGALAAHEAGVPLERLVLVPSPGPDWPTIVSALIDGMDLVVVAAPAGTASGVLRSLMARARQRGCVLIPTAHWPGCDLSIELAERRWQGLQAGYGRLRRQDVTLRSVGRGRAARARTVSMSLPPPSVVGERPADLTDVVIPPPAGGGGADASAVAETPVPGLWRPVAVDDSPGDPWTDLQRQVPPIERKRRHPRRALP